MKKFNIPQIKEIMFVDRSSPNQPPPPTAPVHPSNPLCGWHTEKFETEHWILKFIFRIMTFVGPDYKDMWELKRVSMFGARGNGPGLLQIYIPFYCLNLGGELKTMWLTSAFFKQCLLLKTVVIWSLPSAGTLVLIFFLSN